MAKKEYLVSVYTTDRQVLFMRVMGKPTDKSVLMAFEKIKENQPLLYDKNSGIEFWEVIDV